MSSARWHRRDLRIAVRFPVDVKCEDGSPMVCQARDLSGGGMMLSCPSTPILGSRVELSFKAAESFPELQTSAIVKRVFPRGDYGDGENYLAAVSFVEASLAVSRGLRRLVLDHVMELIDTLREFPAFDKLPELDLMAIAGVCHRVELAPDEVLLRSGEPADSLYVIRRGLVKLDHSNNLGDDAAEVAGTGQIFGEVSTITGLPHDLDITALQPTVLIGMTREGLRFLKERHPETALRLMDVFMRFTGLRLRRLTRKLLSPMSIK